MSLMLSADAHLIPAPDWWLIQRLPDTAHPFVWVRTPIAAFTLGRATPRSNAELVAVLGDGVVTPCRPAEKGRDGADYFQRGDALHPCVCDLSPRLVSDPDWCSYCASHAVHRD